MEKSVRFLLSILLIITLLFTVCDVFAKENNVIFNDFCKHPGEIRKKLKKFRTSDFLNVIKGQLILVTNSINSLGQDSLEGDLKAIYLGNDSELKGEKIIEFQATNDESLYNFYGNPNFKIADGPNKGYSFEINDDNRGFRFINILVRGKKHIFNLCPSSIFTLSFEKDGVEHSATFEADINGERTKDKGVITGLFRSGVGHTTFDADPKQQGAIGRFILNFSRT